MDHKELKKEFDKGLEFIEAARQACIEPGKVFTFTCPHCGGQAKAIKSKYNGHHQGACPGCSLKFVE